MPDDGMGAEPTVANVYGSLVAQLPDAVLDQHVAYMDAEAGRLASEGLRGGRGPLLGGALAGALLVGGLVDVLRREVDE